MQKRNALAFICAIMFLYLFLMNSATTISTFDGSPNLLSELYGLFHQKIIYPAISHNNSELVTATAICVDGNEIVTVRDVSQAKKLISELSLYISSFVDGTVVSSAPKGTLIYRTSPCPAEKILDYNSALSHLKGTPEKSGYYTVKKGETSESIAQKFGISEKALLLLNPESSFIESEKVLTVIPKPAISLKITVRQTKTVTYPIEYRYEYDSSLSSGERKIDNIGQAGIYEITETVVFEDFSEISRQKEEKREITKPIAQTVKVGSMPPPSSGRFIRPLSGGKVTSPFGLRERNDHKGVDIGHEQDAPIHAADGGIVTFSGVSDGYGNTVIIDHKNGFVTLYAHCNRLLVSENETVIQGEQIATVGSTGISTGPHLHFEIQKDGVPVDPALFVALE